MVNYKLSLVGLSVSIVLHMVDYRLSLVWGFPFLIVFVHVAWVDHRFLTQARPNNESLRLTFCYSPQISITCIKCGLDCVKCGNVLVLSCHRRSSRTICGKICCCGWSPRTKYGCHRWSLRTICGTVTGPP